MITINEQFSLWFVLVTSDRLSLRLTMMMSMLEQEADIQEKREQLLRLDEQLVNKLDDLQSRQEELDRYSEEVSRVTGTRGNRQGQR